MIGRLKSRVTGFSSVCTREEVMQATHNKRITPRLSCAMSWTAPRIGGKVFFGLSIPLLSGTGSSSGSGSGSSSSSSSSRRQLDGAGPLHTAVAHLELGACTRFNSDVGELWSNYKVALCRSCSEGFEVIGHFTATSIRLAA